jgi:hypothetical protein
VLESVCNYSKLKQLPAVKDIAEECLRMAIYVKSTKMLVLKSALRYNSEEDKHLKVLRDFILKELLSNYGAVGS